LWSEDPNQHLKDFLKFVNSLDLDVANKERTRLHLFQFSLRDQASNWLERLPTGSITTWEDLTTRFLAQMFQQYQDESLCEAWTRIFEEKKNFFTDPGDGVRINHDGVARLYLMRRSLKILRKFHWAILGGRFNQLSHVSSLLLSKPGEY
ncbi:zinc finger, CCHC-type containing protein, partial [Tanacetum coccineum]